MNRGKLCRIWLFRSFGCCSHFNVCFAFLFHLRIQVSVKQIFRRTNSWQSKNNMPLVFFLLLPGDLNIAQSYF